MHLIVGCSNRETPYFAGANGKGLAVFRVDPDTMAATLVGETATTDNPTFLSLSPDGAYVYANSEVFEWREGLVTAYRFDAATGALHYLNTQPTRGSIAAHNQVTADGRWLLLANYSIGDGGPDQGVAIYGIDADGSLSPPAATLERSGSGADPERQERSHPHSITSAGGDRAVLADLGTDKLTVIDISGGNLTPTFELQLPARSGPRHAVFSPNGQWLYVSNELNSTVASFAYDADAGTLSAADTQPAVPEGKQAGNHTADIQIAPDGRFVYVGNRGNDSIAVFAADGGVLQRTQVVPCGGATPRNLALSPDGTYLLSANQDADSIAVFARNRDSGALADSGRRITVGTPMCMRFAAARS